MIMTNLQQISVSQAIHSELQKLIAEKGWKDLSPIQKAAIPIILNGNDCIVEAPTAGGKTEAVLFPVLTRIAHQKKSSVQILYLAPLRALLNDIELRAETYAKTCGLHCFKWHGDVSQKDKIDEIQNPSQLLLTTPESLEAIMLRKAGWHRFFADLEVIIIDEAHNFASGDRGSHLISLLARLEKSIRRNPQRIAVTATIGNPEQMLRWLAGTDRKTGKRIHVNSTTEKKKDFKILFFDERNDVDNQPENSASYRQFTSLYQLLPLKKSIVFGGSRTKTESLAGTINQMNKMKGSKNPVKVLTHHSSVSKYYREEAENLIKLRVSIESGLEAIISTSTLELGIDVGELNQVVQIGALSSSSAFLQRVGRTGRRPDMPQFFRGLCTSEDDLILLAAVVSLGQKGISEAINFPTKAFHLLAHQLICLSLQNNGIHPNSAWEILSKAHCFSNISVEQFNQLIEFMLERKYFRNVDGLLIVGEEGEKNFLRSNWRRLFAVFDSGPMYDVWDGKKHVGTLDSAFVEALETPFLFVLGGIEWKAYKVKTESREVFAKKAKAGEAPKWVAFSGFDVPYETAKKAGRILFGKELPDYLNPEAQKAIISARNKLKRIHWSEDKWVILTSNYGNAEIWTFAGDRINRTLAKLLTHSGIGIATSSYKSISIKKAEKDQSKLNEIVLAFLNNIKAINRSSIHDLEYELSEEVRLAIFSKFVKCLPENLWYKTLAERIFDFDGLLTELKSNKLR
jgi:ATP-dependent Lhr-like helicase